MEPLMRKRGHIKAKFTILSNFIQTLKSCEVVTAAQVLELELRQSKLESCLDEYEEIQAQLEDAASDPSACYSEREAHEKIFYGILAEASAFLQEHKSVHSNSKHAADASPSSETKMKLPPIRLPEFDGSFTSWLEFRDMFDSLIHNSKSITDIEKFHYLRASLKKGALQIIKNLEFTSQNYNTAWALLCDRFNNNKFLLNSHMKQLFEIDVIRKESPQSLRLLLDSVLKNVRALQSLKQPTESWDSILIFLVTSKLDNVSKREWETQGEECDSFEDLCVFLRKKADMLEGLEERNLRVVEQRKCFASNTNEFTTHDNNCRMCNRRHSLDNCSKFINLNPGDRLNFVKEQHLCFNCLSASHRSFQCRARKCARCSRNHSTLLHRESPRSAGEAAASSSSAATVEATVGLQEETPAWPASARPELRSASRQSAMLGLSSTGNQQVLLSTVLVKVLDKNGKQQYIRALLDSGSESSFITKHACELLGLTVKNVSLAVCPVGDGRMSINLASKLEMHSRFGNFKTAFPCLVMDKITSNVPSCDLRKIQGYIPRGIKLGDPDFATPSKIDLLIGSGQFWDVLGTEKIKLCKNGPFLIDTKLGWILGGNVDANKVNRLLKCNFSSLDFDIQNQLAKFWETEEPPTSSKLAISPEEQYCEEHFVSTFKRLENGRFSVLMPLKEAPSELGDSFQQAKNRFLSVERKCQKSESLRNNYTTFMKEYEMLGHMTKCSEVEIKTQQKCYYLPYHGILKESSTTTKFRVVFDASAPTTSGKSLNSIQCVGPTIQSDLVDILLRFRQHRFVFTADIAKMYRQVEVDPSQRDLMRILWRDEINKNLNVYRMNTLTYGTAAASFCAIRCVQEIANEIQISDPIVANIIKKDAYVDDFISGSDDLTETISICSRLSTALSSGCFDLRKWRSNSVDVLSGLKCLNTQCEDVQFGNESNSKMLGLTWQDDEDVFSFKSTFETHCAKITKRVILSHISQIFDPLGLINPCLAEVKILLQSLWLQKLSWDDEVPPLIKKCWLKFIDDIKNINKIKISRHVISDASERLYGACVYLRSIALSGAVSVQLFYAKSKVAPLKSITLPRLELNAALLGARLLIKVKEALTLNVSKFMCWSDSTLVLGWLKKLPHTLKTYVRNRVSTIQELTSDCTWRYVPTQDNPADILSRGSSPLKLKDSIWWHGPQWLTQNESHWPELKDVNKSFTDIDAEAKIISALTCMEGFSFPFFRFSKLSRLIRCLVYVMRFVNNCIKSRERKIGFLQVSELNFSFMLLLKFSQQEAFPEEYNLLSKKLEISKTSCMYNLGVFLDDSGIIRVGGRLDNCDINLKGAHPIVLCHKHILTRLIFENEHNLNLHVGPNALLYLIRERFWPIKGKLLAKSTIYKCIKCARQRASPVQPMMASLPAHRVRQAFPFQTTGVDFAGPFMLKTKMGRGAKLYKAYLCVFVCFITKAVHLEPVTDLSTAAFSLAFRRFISRRGKPSHLFSDNGGNFVGFHAQLKELHVFLKENVNIIGEELAEIGIAWHFAPPYSPTFCGLQEAGVKSCKFHLKRVIGNAHLTLEQFYTLLTQVEAIMNSRPLTPLSSDPSDMQPLTPSLILLGREATSMDVDPRLEDLPAGRLDVYQRIEQLRQQFWKRWHVEYLSELQQRSKWQRNQGYLQEGMLVFVKEDNLPPLKWQLGRIVKLYPGKDGISRVADIKTSKTVIRRGFQKICPLPGQNVEAQGLQGGDHERAALD